MCLYFEEKDRTATQTLKSSKKTIIAYKILKKDLNTGKLYSQIYDGQPWVPGRVKNSDRESPDLQCDELAFGAINHGIHAYTTREAARKILKYSTSFVSGFEKIYEIWKVQVNTKDLLMISYNYHIFAGDVRELVATKVKLLERVR